MPTLPRFLIAAVAIVAFTACDDEGTSAPAAAPTATVEPTATPLPTPTPSTATGAEKGGTGADPLAVEVLVAAAEAIQEAGTLHFVVDARIKIPSEGRVTTIPVTYEGDAQVPDSLKGTLTVSPGFFSLTMETVHVDGKTYTTDVQSG